MNWITIGNFPGDTSNSPSGQQEENLQIDTYTKVVLTAIVVGVGLLVFDQKPVTDARAENAILARGDRMLLPDLHAGGIWHMSHKKVLYCLLSGCKAWE